MVSLITGINGFVGQYLKKELQQQGHSVFGADLNETQEADSFSVDLCDRQQVAQLISRVKPSSVFHLAGQSSVAKSWEDPVSTMNCNVNSTIYLLDALRDYSPQAKVLLVGSSEEYGTVLPKENPIRECFVPKPQNPYAISKYMMELIGDLYYKTYNAQIIMVRAFNHIGPGQAPNFVLSDFCKQIAEIEVGIRKPIIYVGNLDAKRDFTDVRDIVKAYSTLVANGKPGEVYNVGSGTAISTQSVLERILKFSKTSVSIVIDANKLRPTDIPIIEADLTKISADVKWEKKISLDQTIIDTLEFWRNSVKVESK